MDYETLAMLIDGDWCQGGDGAAIDVINPADEQSLGKLPLATTADLDRALAAAERGFNAWREVPAYDRARVLIRAADLMRERVESLATVLTLEEGKTLPESRTEVNFAADVLEWYGQEARRGYGRIIPGRHAGERQLVEKEPVGPVAAFTPWNFPATTPLRKIGGALAAGCSCIIKPSEETPGIAIGLARALQDAGVPNGVLNVVFGDPAQVSEYLIRSPVIRKITFTGPTSVGKHLARLAADGLKRVTMELGGHAPVIVCDDVDAEAVARLSATAKYRNAGQICIAPTRFFVQRGIYDRFVTVFSEAAEAMNVGDGMVQGSDMGPLANERRLQATESLLDDAQSAGARLTAGGKRCGSPGYFYRPTVLADVPESARIMNDEPFGPVAVIRSFDTLDEALAAANRLPFGLAAYAFTRAVDRADTLERRIESGMLGINQYVVARPEAPFGGIKDSGYGYECGIEGLDSYQVTKFVARMDG